MIGPDGDNGDDIIGATWEVLKSGRTTDVAPTHHTLEYPSMSVADLAENWAGVTANLERNFNSSNQAGVAEIGHEVARATKRCGGTQIVLAGYSQGAWVIDLYVRQAKIRHPEALKKIAAVELYGDPQWDHDSNGRGLARIASQYVSAWKLSGDYPGFGDRIQSLCANKDPICGDGYKPVSGVVSWAQGVDAIKCVTDSECGHYLYKPTSTSQGGNFLASKVYPK
ncbi:cutinase family protein [Streptomyces sp. B21-102]|uniref:cutinase family protein n=1 Tax=Streptomyces sp. B21-102 TaxID=3039416 RepID=UPI002FF0131A